MDMNSEHGLDRSWLVYGVLFCIFWYIFYATPSRFPHKIVSRTCSLHSYSFCTFRLFFVSYHIGAISYFAVRLFFFCHFASHYTVMIHCFWMTQFCGMGIFRQLYVHYGPGTPGTIPFPLSRWTLVFRSSRFLSYHLCLPGTLALHHQVPLLPKFCTCCSSLPRTLGWDGTELR